MRILLVRLRLIGDVVFTTPIVAAVKRAYPDSRITYLVEESAAPVVAANPYLAEVIAVRHRRGWRRLADDMSLGRRLAGEHFDLAIDLHGGPRGAWLTWASRAPVRVGYDVPGRSWMYTRVVPRPKAYRPRHAVENQWDLLVATDPSRFAVVSRDTNPVEMWASIADREALDAFLRHVAPEAAPLAVVHVSAGNPFRRWPEAAFADLVAGLVREPGDRVVLVTAGPSDRDAAHRVVDAARALAPEGALRVRLADALSLGALRALCDRAALFIGGDSGPMHVASTSRVPIVGLYGPTLPERSAPWRSATWPDVAIDSGPLPCRPCDQRVCAPGDFRCLTEIPAATVLTEARRLLEARP